VHGGRLRVAGGGSALPEETLRALPHPEPAAQDEPWNVLITGIGGTGVVTIGALIGMAAHLEGRASTCLDMTGLAQKGGAVISHVRIGASPEAIYTPRIAARSADALIACDPIVAASPDAVLRIGTARTRSVVNTHIAPTAEFVRNNDIDYDAGRYLGLVHDQSRDMYSLDATRVASGLLGDAVTTNILMLGYAYQEGLIPLGHEALERAIELNGVAVDTNRRAFAWGRLLAHDAGAVEALLPPRPEPQRMGSTDDLIAHREQLLTRYHNRAYARRYRELVDRVRAAERAVVPGQGELTAAVARYYHKLLAYKDEYEVARLYTDGEFRAKLEAQFEGDYTIRLELAPPLWSSTDPDTGRPRKHSYGRWMLVAMRLLAVFKFLRGSRFDIFGRTQERLIERQLIVDYEKTVNRLLASLSQENRELAVEIASIPEQIRGYDAVKLENVRRAKQRETELLDRYEKSAPLLVVQGSGCREDGGR